MIEPISIAERLMYCTVRITAEGTTPGGDASVSRGTGFFYNFPLKEAGQVVPVIITNKHVVRGSTSQTFLLHIYNPSNGEKSPTGTFSVQVNATLGQGWFEHPDQDVDLCALPIAEIQKLVPAPNQPFYIPQAGAPDDEALTGLDAIENVVMIGYPNGLWDHVNNLPLIRRGITATHPGIEYKIEGQSGPGVTVVDMACFPGSSGSPVFVFDQGTFHDKRGTVTMGTRAIFLGVLFSGPVVEQDGKIVVKNIPTKTIPVAELRLMMNLGYVIKPKHIISLGKYIYTEKGLAYPE